MATTNFQSGTVIASTWLNDVNSVTYNKTFPDRTVALTTPTVSNFIGTGSQTVFTLLLSPVGSNTTNVFINGVYQNKNTYSISSTTLTFTQAPPVTSLIEISYA